MTIRIAALTGALALTAACAHTRGGGAERPVIAAVELVGAAALDREPILEGLATRPTGRWPWSEVQRVDRVAVATDERRIETYYALRGYHEAEVEHEVVPEGERRVRVVFRVREGPPFPLAAVAIDGLEGLPAPTQEAVRSPLPLQEGRIARHEDLETASALLEHRLREAGYLAAEVDRRLDVHLDRRSATATLTAIPGPLHRYGPIELGGLVAYPAGPLRAITRRLLPRGAIASPSRLDEAQSRISDLGAFRGVRVEPAIPEAADGEATIHVRAEELPVHSVVLGGGVGVEQSVQQLRLLLEYGNTSLFGSGTRLTWRNEGAFRFVPSLLDRDRSGLTAESAIEVTRPEVWPRTGLAARAAYRHVFRDAYDADVLTARLGAPHRLGRGVRVVPALNHEWYVDLSPRAAADPAALPLSLGCEEPCRFTYLSTDLVVDRRDDPVSTRRGALVLVALQYAAPLTAGFHYARLEPEARAFFPVGERLTLAARVKLGALLGIDDREDAPLPQRFFGGGEGGHRGFGAEQLAPVVEARDGSIVPIGGRGLWLATAELRRRVGGSWAVVAFADVGNVTVDPLDLRPSRAHLAPGLGVRYHTIAGPVRLDVAYRLPRRPREALVTGRTIEASAGDYFAFFLSLGEAF